MQHQHSPKDSGSTSMAGGFFIALFTVVGVITGGIMGQPSLGLLIGLGIGVLAALGVWLRDRAKEKAEGQE